jgi:hypothetical protein
MKVEASRQGRLSISISDRQSGTCFGEATRQFAGLRRHPGDEVQAGCLLLAPLPAGVDLRDDKHRILAEGEAMISLAGDLAQFRLRGSRWRKELSGSDLLGLGWTAAHSGKSPGQLDSHLDRLAAKVVHYLEIFWPRVEALAGALLHVRELRGRQVTAILGTVPRPPSSHAPTGRGSPIDRESSGSA